uniref:Calcitonin peptide-like domain-containing protein n=1 Tax=Pygocentrus nattereri TaxID=42514 RepID=A0A3B4DHL6_PYGNA
LEKLTGIVGQNKSQSKVFFFFKLTTLPFYHHQDANLPSLSSTSQQHHIEKRRCNTATCMTQRLADFLVRSSNTIGTVYIPTNVGSSAYGKREVFQSPNVMPL